MSARGWRALALAAAAFAALFVMPRFLTAPPSRAEVESLTRDVWSREVRDAWLPRMQSAPDSLRVLGPEVARALEAVERRRIQRIDVKRSWIGPPFARHWAWVAAVRTTANGPAEYMRINPRFASRVSRAWWYVPLM